MIKAIEKIRETAKILTSQISIGWDYFVLAKFIREAYAKGRIKGAHEVLTQSYAACWDAAILSVTKVMDKQSGSLSLSYLLNCVEASSKDYPSLTTDELKKQIADHRQELESIEARIPGIWDERDRIVAHLDRRHVNAPASVYTNPPIELNDLHGAIRALRRILLIYNAQLQAGGISIDQSQMIWDDLEKLIRLLETDSKSGLTKPGANGGDSAAS